jgi:hypothetical protein
MSARRRRRRIAVAGFAVAAVFVVAFVLRIPLLRGVGHALVATEPVASADVIVVAADAGGAGVLEAADLVSDGVASRVAVVGEPPRLEDLEFVRRGLPDTGAAAVKLRELALLGIADVELIAAGDSGTHADSDALRSWCDRTRYGSVIVVVNADHSRRMKRIIERSLKGQPTRVIVRSSRYSAFDPDHWWETREGFRTTIIEWQKLALDVVLHPLQDALF